MTVRNISGMVGCMCGYIYIYIYHDYKVGYFGRIRRDEVICETYGYHDY